MLKKYKVKSRIFYIENVDQASWNWMWLL